VVVTNFIHPLAPCDALVRDGFTGIGALNSGSSLLPEFGFRFELA